MIVFGIVIVNTIITMNKSLSIRKTKNLIFKKLINRKLHILVSKKRYRLKIMVLKNLTREAFFTYWGYNLTVKYPQGINKIKNT